VQRHPHQQRPDRAPVLRLQRLLTCQRSGYGIRRGGKCRAERIADRLEDMPAMRRDYILQNLIMSTKRDAHRRWLLFPTPSRALNIGEQEGDRAAGKFCGLGRRGGLQRRRDGGRLRHAGDGRGHLADGKHSACGTYKLVALLGGNAEMLCEQLGDLC
jgi:hypothetical protein